MAVLYSLTIPRIIWSQNKRDAAHWSDRARDKKAWYANILLSIKRMVVDKPDRPRLVTIRSFRTKLLDYANLVGGAKGLVDALVQARLIRDDSPEWVDIAYYQEKCPRGYEKTEIEVLESNSNNNQS